MGTDKRIGGRFLRADQLMVAHAFKDTRALVATAKKTKTSLSIINTVINSNEKRSELLLKRINYILKIKLKIKKSHF